jgi:hypothetical protein
MKRIFLAALIVASGFATQSFAFDTPTWDNCVNNGPGSPSTSDFDTCTLSFAPQGASELTSINNPVDAEYHTHGNATAVHSLEVHVNGGWVTLWSVTGSDTDELVADITTPISFTGGTVDGIRFTVSEPIDQAYHSFPDGMTFTFSGTGAPPVDVPTLPELALIMLMLAMAGLGVYSQRRRFGNSA